MKKLVLFVSVLALGLTSCNKDDDGGTSAALEGKWEFSKQGASANGQEVLVDYDHTEGCPKDYMQIGTTTMVDHSFFKEGADCVDETSSVTYTRSGNTLTITEGTDTYTSEIIQLDGNTLKIKDSNEVGGQTFDYITLFTRA